MDRDSSLRVVLFSGGRGSDALTRQLLEQPAVSLTIAINGYDDGASTGEVRRFLPDMLGPSDFRKNASRLALALGSCSSTLVQFLDARLPQPIEPGAARARLLELCASREPGDPAAARLRAFLDHCPPGAAFDFGDCSVGNLVFAGAFLRAGRDFNAALDDYCSLLGLPPGAIENVTDGGNAHLVALDADGHLLPREADIVAAGERTIIRDLFLLDAPIDEETARRLSSVDAHTAAVMLAARQPAIRLNPRLAQTLAAADLIIYAPGTQHSSLFPSYLTPGLSETIAANVRAIKLLITNIRPDVEIAGVSAVDLVDRALFYLTDKGRRAIPAPSLITHYLLNEPGAASAAPYVPLGAVDRIEDPRLVRIANYEDGVSGRHDALRVLAPFIDMLASPPRRPSVSVLLHGGTSANKVAQSLLELVRGGIMSLPIVVSVFCVLSADLDSSLVGHLPFPVACVPSGPAFLASLRTAEVDFVALFDSSGMYRGEDLVALLAALAMGRFDAVWGSRRLSVRDIRESYRSRYSARPLFGAISYVGSHLLSLLYLLLYGRYISDTLSAVRVAPASDVAACSGDPGDIQNNQVLLARLLRRKAEILELPVQFVPLAPEQVKRTTPMDGLRAVLRILKLRLT